MWWAVGIVVLAALVIVGFGVRALQPASGSPSPTSSPQPTSTPVSPPTDTPAPTINPPDPPVMTGTIRVGERPVAIALDVDTDLAFTANQNGGDVSVVDLVSGVVIDTVAVPGRPSGVASNGTGLIYVADGHGSKVYAMDLATGSRVAAWKVGRHPGALAMDVARGVLYVAVGGGVVVVDVTSGAVLDRLDLPAADLAVDPDTHELWVLGPDGGPVTTVDPDTQDRSVAESAPASGLDLDGVRRRLYLADGGLREVDLQSGGTRAFAVDGAATAVRIDPQHRIAYLADPEANLVTAIGVG